MLNKKCLRDSRGIISTMHENLKNFNNNIQFTRPRNSKNVYPKMTNVASDNKLVCLSWEEEFNCYKNILKKLFD